MERARYRLPPPVELLEDHRVATEHVAVHRHRDVTGSGIDRERHRAVREGTALAALQHPMTLPSRGRSEEAVYATEALVGREDHRLPARAHDEVDVGGRCRARRTARSIANGRGRPR